MLMEKQSITQHTVRECTPADAGVVASLGARLFTEAYGPTHPEPELSRYLRRAYSPAAFEDAINEPGGFVLVIEESTGSPVGYVWVRPSPAPPDGVSGEAVAEIVRFYVATERQGRGLGAALMTRCFDVARARGYDTVWLQVWKEAPWAIAFYDRMGFKVVGSAKFYFGEQVGDDHIMSRPL